MSRKSTPVAKEPKESDQSKRVDRELGAAEDENHWEERLRKVAKHKQAPDSPEHKEVGDETNNPLPDRDESQKHPEGGDPGRN